MFTLPNGAHLHLLINHFPIMGLIFWLWLLAFWIFAKNKSLIAASYVFFILSALSAIVAFLTWGLAANVVIDLEWTNRSALRLHYEAAQLVTPWIILLWLISGVWLYLRLRSKKDFMVIYILIFSFLMTIGVSYVWYLGWEIRHPELKIPNSSVR
ncbi:MAG: hypothetical protein ACD_2C00111G0006 [uncultured bacterium (gcode 4)]|uniref:DUF2231 domain-containing protein n=1 Tax=uncultured bacterium (gcode 4) TaxID=1234023 RepID=K2H1L2_9BACT|nr:MAG: hypothetical protein ACD_2C00111G0006 [uncultured bacterium (gcode 4)]